MKPAQYHWPEIAAPLTEAAPDSQPPPLGQRLLWMVGIWLASTGALLVVALVLRSVLRL